MNALRIDAALAAEAEKMAGAIPGCSSHRIRELLSIYYNAPTAYQLSGNEYWLVRFPQLETEIRAWVAKGRQAAIATMGKG